MAQVTINGPGVITGSFVSHGITFYGWTFNATVDGQAGVYTVWLDTNDPSYNDQAAADAAQDLEQNPGLLEGIAQNDGSGGPGDGRDGPDGPGGEDGPDGPDGDDGGDGVLAGNGDGDGFGDSV